MMAWWNKLKNKEKKELKASMAEAEVYNIYKKIFLGARDDVVVYNRLLKNKQENLIKLLKDFIKDSELEVDDKMISMEDILDMEEEQRLRMFHEICEEFEHGNP